MDMEAQVTVKNLALLVKEGKVSIQAVDDAVSRVLKMKFQLGLFDDPYRFSDEAREKAALFPRPIVQLHWMLQNDRSSY